MWPTFAYRFAFHIAGIVLSSRGRIRTVHALPHPLDWLDLGVVGSYFALRPFEKNKRGDMIDKLRSMWER